MQGVQSGHPRSAPGENQAQHDGDGAENADDDVLVPQKQDTKAADKAP